MTIASTGNKITDKLARASKANQAREAAAKSKAAKAGKAGARMGKIRAGRAAVKAGAGKGRGCVIKTHASGKSAGGALSYCMDKESTLVSSNCGTTKDEINRDMMRCAGMRNIKNPINHASFSLPAGETKTVEQWRQMIDVAREEIGLDDSFPYAAILHDEEDHQNVHIIYSKVSDQGKIFDDYRLGLRFAALEDVLEDRFNLKLVPVVRDQSRINLGKPEIEKSIRTNVQPERMQLNAIVTAAAAGHPSVTEFISRCAAEGVVVRPNIASTGKLNGFAFSLVDSGIEYKGSKIGCGWSQLQKIGVTYEQDREAQTLTDLVNQLEAGQRTDDSAQPEIAADRDLTEEVAGMVGKTEDADRTAATTDQVAEVRVESVQTASVDPVRPGITATTDRPLARVQTPTPADDQQEPTPIECEAFEQIKRDLYATNGDEKSRSAAAISMSWAQQAEVRQILKNIDAFHKRMGQATAAPETQADRSIHLPTM